jgi:hypothetical protein
MNKKDAKYLWSLVESGEIVLCRYEPDQFCTVIGVDLENMVVEMVPGDAQYDAAVATAFTEVLKHAAREHFLVATGISWPQQP